MGIERIDSNEFVDLGKPSVDNVNEKVQYNGRSWGKVAAGVLLIIVGLVALAALFNPMGLALGLTGSLIGTAVLTLGGSLSTATGIMLLITSKKEAPVEEEEEIEHLPESAFVDSPAFVPRTSEQEIDEDIRAKAAELKAQGYELIK